MIATVEERPASATQTLPISAASTDHPYTAMRISAQNIYAQKARDLNDEGISPPPFSKADFNFRLFCFPGFSQRLLPNEHKLKLVAYCNENNPISLQMLADMKFVSRNDAKLINALGINYKTLIKETDIRHLQAEDIAFMTYHNPQVISRLLGIVSAVSVALKQIGIPEPNITTDGKRIPYGQLVSSIVRSAKPQPNGNVRRPNTTLKIG